MSGIYINDDAWNFFANRSVPPWNCQHAETMDEAGLKRQIDYYAVPGVKGILFNANAMRAFFDSQTFEPLWLGMEEGPDGKARFQGREIETCNNYAEDLQTLCRNVKTLFENVPDPYRVRYDYCRKKGVEMWISMRMNDIHYADDDSRITHGNYWRTRPDLHRAEYRKNYTFWFCRCFDFEQKEVRDHHMALVREYFDRFEMDGFELDWMRSPFFFKPGFAEQGGYLLTEFMREVKDYAAVAARRWGHPIKINVRVPARPEEALYLGLDVFTWMREKLTDMITPSPYFCSSESTMPIKLWRHIVPEDIVLAPCMEQHVGCNYQVRMKSLIEIDAGLAATYFYQGADCIYLFNHMYRDGLADRDKQQMLYRDIGIRNNAERMERRHVVTGHECMVEGMVNIPAFDEMIPSMSCRSVRLNIGGGTSGRNAHIILGITNAAESLLEVRLNTTLCVKAQINNLPELPMFEMEKTMFSIPADVLHDGENVIDIINKGKSEILLKWAEIKLDRTRENLGGS